MTASMRLVRRSVYGFEKQRTPSITRLTRQRENYKWVRREGGREGGRERGKGK